jgi:hypothetical protein
VVARVTWEGGEVPFRAMFHWTGDGLGKHSRVPDHKEEMMSVEEM